MNEQDFLDEKWVLKFLGWSPKTLANKRCSGEAPPVNTKGTIRRYPKNEFWKWYMDDPKVLKKKRAS